MQRWGIRPLILLNSNSGLPCPEVQFNLTVTASAAVGSTQLQLSDVSRLLIGKSGLSTSAQGQNLFHPLPPDSTSFAAESLITAISGNTVTLSEPLAQPVNANTVVSIQTLKYRPFSVPGSADYNESIAGWQRYVGSTAQFVSAALGTGGSADKGFDMEVWNELTFGSDFLYINNYYSNRPYNYDGSAIYLSGLIAATAVYVSNNATAFQGVQFGDGFANTTPWPASSTEPARIHAIDKHPYHGWDNFTNPNTIPGTNLNALGQVDTYAPTYSELFPEYFGTLIQTETGVRDMGPLPSFIGGTSHGRYERPGNPTPVWITEVGIQPQTSDPAAALAFKAKTTARYFSFFLNKGVEQLDLFTAYFTGDTDVDILQNNFVTYARSNTVYPANDTMYTSPALATLGRMTAWMRFGLDPTLTATRQLSVDFVTDSHNHYQFPGDGTAAHPLLYDREVLAILPYQVNAGRFVIPYYVMTWDVTQSLGRENFTVKLSGLVGAGATVTSYDPLTGQMVPVQVVASTGNSLTVVLTASDSPYLLTVQEPPNYSSSFTAAGLALNGGAKVTGGALQLTDGGLNEARSAFFTTPLDVRRFTTDFTFQLTKAAADGFTFTIQGNRPTALGGNGGHLGYYGIGHSVAIKFDLHNNAGVGNNSTGLFLNGADPTVNGSVNLTGTGIDLHNGDTFAVQMIYDGSALMVTITDITTYASWATQTYAVDIASVVGGGGMGYAGFTAGTGSETATQNVLDWVWTGSSPSELVQLRNNRVGIVADGSSSFPNGGLDGQGHALSANLLTGNVTWNGTPFALGSVVGNNVTISFGQTINLPLGSYTSLSFLAVAVNGSQANQTFVVHYDDGSTDTFTQSLSDWTGPQSYAGESEVVAMGYRNNSDGTKDVRPVYVYGYQFALNPSKKARNITMPNNHNVVLLAMTLKH